MRCGVMADLNKVKDTARIEDRGWRIEKLESTKSAIGGCMIKTRSLRSTMKYLVFNVVVVAAALLSAVGSGQDSPKFPFLTARSD
jgi:hypothetical protein